MVLSSLCDCAGKCEQKCKLAQDFVASLGSTDTDTYQENMMLTAIIGWQ